MQDFGKFELSPMVLSLACWSEFCESAFWSALCETGEGCSSAFVGVRCVHMVDRQVSDYVARRLTR